MPTNKWITTGWLAVCRIINCGAANLGGHAWLSPRYHLPLPWKQRGVDHQVSICSNSRRFCRFSEQHQRSGVKRSSSTRTDFTISPHQIVNKKVSRNSPFNLETADGVERRSCRPDCSPSPPVQVWGSSIVQGRAPPLVSGVDGGSTSNQRFQTLIVTAGSRVVEGGSGK